MRIYHWSHRCDSWRSSLMYWVITVSLIGRHDQQCYRWRFLTCDDDLSYTTPVRLVTSFQKVLVVVSAVGGSVVPSTSSAVATANVLWRHRPRITVIKVKLTIARIPRRQHRHRHPGRHPRDDRRRVVQLATGITSGNCACRTCRRVSSRRCRCRRRGMRA